MISRESVYAETCIECHRNYLPYTMRFKMDKNDVSLMRCPKCNAAEKKFLEENAKTNPIKNLGICEVRKRIHIRSVSTARLYSKKNKVAAKGVKDLKKLKESAI